MYHKETLQILNTLDTVKLQHFPMSANETADTLPNLPTTLALEAEKDMTNPVYDKWMVMLFEDEFV